MDALKAGSESSAYSPFACFCLQFSPDQERIEITLNRTRYDHGRVTVPADIGSKPQLRAAPVNSRSQSWQPPAFRRTLPVHHSVRRLTSYSHDLEQAAPCRYKRTHATACSSRTGVLLVLASQLKPSCLKMRERLLLHAD